MKEINIKTRDFGEINIPEERILDFPNGIFAFEGYKKFALLSPLGDDASPMWLQSTENEEPCFIVFEAAKVASNYSPVMTDEDKALIDYQDDDEIHFLSIAVIPKDYKKTTVNLKSPIVINLTKSKAAQIVLEDSYPLRFPIFEKEEEK